MGSHRTKEDDVAKISTSIYITNFPETCSAKDLFNTCKQYGHVVDAFIPSKRSKAEKRFGFVRFINVFNVERLISNLCTVWIDRFKLRTNITRFQRPHVNVKNHVLKSTGGGKNYNTSANVSDIIYKNDQRPTGFGKTYMHAVKVISQHGSRENEVPVLVLEDDCLLSKDLSKCLLGRVKEFASLANLKMTLNNKGFMDIKIQYIGEMWVMLEFGTEKSMKLFRDNVSVGSWFSKINQASMDFVTEGRIAWVELESIPNSWLGPDFLEDAEDEDQSDVDSKDGRFKVHESGSCEESDGEGVPETLFDEKDKVVSNKDLEFSMKYPPGFTPNEGSDGASMHVKEGKGGNSENGNEGNVDVDNAVPSGNHSGMNSNEGGTESVCSGHFKKSKVPRTGGSIMSLLDDVVKVGQVIGYKKDDAKQDWVKELCAKNKVNFLALQETKMENMKLFCVKTYWGNMAFDYVHSDSVERYLSDHRPILLREYHFDYGTTPFRFFHYWFEMEGFSKIMEDTWKESLSDESNAMIRMMKKLKFLKTKIREWNKINMLCRKNVKAQCKADLEAVEVIINSGNGDENSSFFQGMINKKWNTLSIHGIMVDGIWIDDPNLVKREFLMHFSSRFSKPDNRRALIQMRFPKRLSLEQQVELESKVSNEEIKRGVWDCGMDKAPSPDGFTFGFYRYFWYLIDNDVYNAVKYFFMHGEIPKGCNSSFIALIPKILDANLVKDFCPISLIRSLYKIIAKILMNRLIGVLGDIVNEVRYAFIADRQIFDGPFILDELIQWCKRKKKQFLVFKVDFEKTYDSVRSSRGSIILNGSPTEEFQFYKGLKQGDTPSPFLFILIMESLHLSFQRVEVAGMFKAIKLGSSVSISHMFYADNAVFIGQWVIKAIYGEAGNMDAKVKAGSTSCWMSIVHEAKFLVSKGTDFFKFMRFKLGNGENARFSEDRWIESDMLKKRFPRVSPRGGVEHEQFEELVTLVHDVRLVPMFDRWTWTSLDISVVGHFLCGVRVLRGLVGLVGEFASSVQE
nr:RNA-directed DNA polymerase, eukaryota, reverse transcriptase zinc-binding domain protein [Tanacetum cinerariifolium]